MLSSRSIVLALALVPPLAAQIPEPTWDVIAPNCATYVLGIGAASDNTVYAAGALNGIGNVVSLDFMLGPP